MKIFMKHKTIVLDLDDTLISTHYRQFCCIENYLALKKIDFISYEKYYHIRHHQNLSNSELLKICNANIDMNDFKQYYLANIESPEYLAFDSVIVEKEYLKRLKDKSIHLILLSLRNNEANSKEQLRLLGISQYFDEVHFVKHNALNNSKVDILKQLQKENNIFAFCGDSESDHKAALLAGIDFIQVKTSLYSLPDFADAAIFPDINEYFLSFV